MGMLTSAVGREGFEPPKNLVRQIYSLMPLAARPPARLALSDGCPSPSGGTARPPLRGDTRPWSVLRGVQPDPASEASGGTRTHNLWFTKPELCLLSYASKTCHAERISIGRWYRGRKAKLSPQPLPPQPVNSSAPPVSCYSLDTRLRRMFSIAPLIRTPVQNSERCSVWDLDKWSEGQRRRKRQWDCVSLE